MDTPNKLFLLDAFALIYRAHFAFSKNPRINSKGFNTGCVLGFTNTLLEVINKEKPTHLAVCFDMKGPTFRHEEFTEYKANRDAQPEDITLSIPVIRDIIKAYNIPILEKAGFEADDVVGTVAKQCGSPDMQVYMMTPDKDYSQLVDENIFLYKPNFMGKGVEIHDVAKTLEKWDIERVDQVIDILGLEGDAVDNIPGIPGIGKKTAIKLLKEYGTIEGLLENTDKLKGKQKENVINFGEQGLLSKRLATIVIDVPVEYNKEDLILTEPNTDKVKDIFEEMEFRTLSKKLFGGGTSTSTASAKKAMKKVDSSQMSLFDTPAGEAEIEVPVEKKNINSSRHNYHHIDTPELRKELRSFLEIQDEFCFDTETTSLETIEAEIVGISFSYKAGDAYYVSIPRDQKEAQEVINEFKELLENKEIGKIGQNLKYDISVLKNYGIKVNGKCFDTMLAHYLLFPDQRHNMDVLAENFLNYTPVSITELIGKGAKQKNMGDIPPAEVSDYACEDADITLQLKEVFEPLLKESKVDKLFEDIEIPLFDVLADIERNGVKINQDALAELSKNLEKDALEEQEAIFKIAGTEFNIASPKQLGVILFDELKLSDKAKKTKTGQYATGEEVLSKLAGEHEIAERILRFREYQKLRSTYVDALPKMVSPVDNKIHTDYNQAVAATGRLSSNNPNLQNIPVRTERGREIRKAFIPSSDNHTLFSADYSQIELRIMAAFSEDESMVNAFKNGIDIHSTTAAKVFKVALEDVEPGMRRKAKEVNFGLIYGTSAFGLAQNLKISRTEASEIIKSYWEEFPAIKSYMDRIVNEARDQEFVETILGRRRYLRDINSRNMTLRGHAERNAINAPIQGSAADMIKVAMINIHNWMKEEQLQSKMILQVHDELVFDVINEELDIIQTKVPEFMKNAIKMEVPMDVGVGLGKNWLEAH